MDGTRRLRARGGLVKLVVADGHPGISRADVQAVALGSWEEIVKNITIQDLVSAVE